MLIRPILQDKTAAAVKQLCRRFFMRWARKRWVDADLDSNTVSKKMYVLCKLLRYCDVTVTLISVPARCVYRQLDKVNQTKTGSTFINKSRVRLTINLNGQLVKKDRLYKLSEHRAAQNHDLWS